MTNTVILFIINKIMRNSFEKRIHRSLKRNKVSFGYECERLTYVLAGSYIPDFVIRCPNGKLYIETKGYLRPEDKRKLIAVKRQHPEIDLRIVFYSENKKYIKWCIKHGFKYAIGSIPKDWLNGL